MKAAWRSPCMRWQPHYYLKDMSHNVKKEVSPRRWYRAAMSRDVTNRRSESGRLIYRRNRDERVYSTPRVRARSSRVSSATHSLWYGCGHIKSCVPWRRDLSCEDITSTIILGWAALYHLKSSESNPSPERVPSLLPSCACHLYLLYDKRE